MERIVLEPAVAVFVQGFSFDDAYAPAPLKVSL